MPAFTPIFDGANMVLDGVFFSHLLVWGIGAIAAVGGVLTVLGFWSMGRSGYRKD